MIQISARPEALLPDMTLGRRRTRPCSLAVRQALPGSGCWDRSPALLKTEPCPKEDGPQSEGRRRPGPEEDGPRPSGTFQNGRWGGHPVPAGGAADRHGGAARNVMRSEYSKRYDHISRRMAFWLRQYSEFYCRKVGRDKESCAILVAQRMSPAAGVRERGRQARSPATGVDGNGAARPVP